MHMCVFLAGTLLPCALLPSAVALLDSLCAALVHAALPAPPSVDDQTSAVAAPDKAAPPALSPAVQLAQYVQADAFPAILLCLARLARRLAAAPPSLATPTSAPVSALGPLESAVFALAAKIVRFMRLLVAPLPPEKLTLPAAVAQAPAAIPPAFKDGAFGGFTSGPSTAAQPMPSHDGEFGNFSSASPTAPTPASSSALPGSSRGDDGFGSFLGPPPTAATTVAGGASDGFGDDWGTAPVLPPPIPAASPALSTPSPSAAASSPAVPTTSPSSTQAPAPATLLTAAQFEATLTGALGELAASGRCSAASSTLTAALEALCAALLPPTPERAELLRRLIAAPDDAGEAAAGAHAEVTFSHAQPLPLAFWEMRMKYLNQEKPPRRADHVAFACSGSRWSPRPLPLSSSLDFTAIFVVLLQGSPSGGARLTAEVLFGRACFLPSPSLRCHSLMTRSWMFFLCSSALICTQYAAAALHALALTLQPAPPAPALTLPRSLPPTALPAGHSPAAPLISAAAPPVAWLALPASPVAAVLPAVLVDLQHTLHAVLALHDALADVASTSLEAARALRPDELSAAVVAALPALARCAEWLPIGVQALSVLRDALVVMDSAAALSAQGPLGFVPLTFALARLDRDAASVLRNSIFPLLAHAVIYLPPLAAMTLHPPPTLGAPDAAWFSTVSSCAASLDAQAWGIMVAMGATSPGLSTLVGPSQRWLIALFDTDLFKQQVALLPPALLPLFQNAVAMHQQSNAPAAPSAGKSGENAPPGDGEQHAQGKKKKKSSVRRIVTTDADRDSIELKMSF